MYFCFPSWFTRSVSIHVQPALPSPWPVALQGLCYLCVFIASGCSHAKLVVSFRGSLSRVGVKNAETVRPRHVVRILSVTPGGRLVANCHMASPGLLCGSRRLACHRGRSVWSWWGKLWLEALRLLGNGASVHPGSFPVSPAGPCTVSLKLCRTAEQALSSSSGRNSFLFFIIFFKF